MVPTTAVLFLGPIPLLDALALIAKDVVQDQAIGRDESLAVSAKRFSLSVIDTVTIRFSPYERASLPIEPSQHYTHVSEVSIG